MNVTADRTSISPAAEGPGADRTSRGVRTTAGLAVALAVFSASPSALGHPGALTPPAAGTTLAARAGDASPDCQSSLGWQGTCSNIPE